jgi:hypothetical protein
LVIDDKFYSNQQLAAFAPLSTPKALTAAELAQMVSRLSGREISTRRVRHLLVDGSLGTELQARQQGQTRMFGVLDLALVRLAAELEGHGISARVARVVLTYLRDDLVRAFKSSAPVSLAIRGVRASLEPSFKARPPGLTAWVPLREIWKGLDGEVAKLRAEKPTVWMWSEVPAQAVKRSTLV